ncbi:MAG: lauroyl acyltransferase [Rhodospirillales bacterium]|nr:lauroyl acyltransferase [Rhodospirillales bacterium]
MAEPAYRKLFRRTVGYPLEALGLVLGLGLFGLLPVDAASNLGGWLGRTFGPRLPVTRWARVNLRLAFPGKSETEIETVVRGMWDNLGRTAGEYPHLGRIAAPGSDRVELIDLDDSVPLQEKVRPGVLVSGHLANWEIMPVVAGRIGIDLAVVARIPNNPLVRPLVDRLRGVAGGRRIAKGAEGVKQAIAVLRGGATLGILADQKMNDGIEAEFFGRPAMTAAGPAQLALALDCPLVPARIERLGAARFRITFHPPLARPATGNRQRDVAALTAALNRLLEDWIGERPQEWLWLHRRWPRATYEDLDRPGV